MADLWKENKIGIIIAVVLITIGTAYYFITGLGIMGSTAELSKESVDVLANAQIKVAVIDGKVLKLFALSSNNALSRLRATEGSAIPEEDTVVIGSEEAKMMQKENLFRKAGDKLEDFFGINTTVGGVLEQTDTFIDDFHFLSGENFRQLNGETGRVYIVLDEIGAPELHMTLKENETPPLSIVFAEGNYSNYQVHDIAGVIYYPAILGAQEAQMMREEKQFTKVGDELEIRGRKVIVVGVLSKTGSALDMMHITPLDAYTP
jgi:hypothetical protein